MSKTPVELRKWAEANAEDCLRYQPPLPVQEIKRSIVGHFEDAYRLGFQDASSSYRRALQFEAALYLIVFKIDTAHRAEYRSLWEKLEAIGAKAIFDSVWILISSRNLTAKTFATDLNRYLRPEDSLLVIEAGKDAGCTATLPEMTSDDLLRWTSRARL